METHMTSQERLADLYSSAITELSLVSHYEEEKQTHALRAQAYATLYLAEMVESKLATIETALTSTGVRLNQ